MSHSPITQSPTLPKWVLIVLGLLAGGIVVVIALLFLRGLNGPSAASQQAAEYDGSTPIDPPRAMPDFTLTNHHGEETRLSDLRGKFTLMSFGYTHCPDICPITLNEFKQIEQALGEQAEKINFVFISVDSPRDTPEALADYFRKHELGERFVGLTGTENALRQLGIDYGLYFELDPPAEDGNYDVNHTSGYFLLDDENRWRMRYAYLTEQQVILEDLLELLRQG